MTILKVELKPPTRFYTRAEINRAFGLGNPDQFGTEGNGPEGSGFPTSSPNATTVQAIGIAGVLGVIALGIVGTGLTTYFVWRVAKKQRWV